MAEDESPWGEGVTVRPHPWGVGMPEWLLLHDFGSFVHQAFGRYPVLVGSALTEKARVRDVDVRLVLPMPAFLAQIGPACECGRPGTRWAAFCVAFSLVGKQMTGLPVDFQIQHPGVAAPYNAMPRLPFGGSAADAEAYTPELAPEGE